MITLTLKEQPNVPLEAETLSPDITSTLTHDALCALPVQLGKRQRRLDDFFTVEGEASDEITINGDARKIKWIGRGMTRGRIQVEGHAGMHLGAYMKGGSIEVSGNVTDWTGAEMTGGMIRVRGNAGGQIGAAYRGSLAGMTEGTIIVHGNAGLEVGMRMKRGVIFIGGAVRDFAGLQMRGGTIVLGGGAELRTGAWMMRGTIVSLKPLPLLPTFAYAATYNPTFIRILARTLRNLALSLPYEEREGAYERYTGDASVPGKGEILVWHPQANATA